MYYNISIILYEFLMTVARNIRILLSLPTRICKLTCVRNKFNPHPSWHYCP